MGGDRPFLILALEGGGYRALFAARLLEQIEQAWGVDWTSRFRLLAGTSTGAIMAAALASGMSASELVRFYERHGAKVFPRSRRSRLGLFVSRYDLETLARLLEQTLPDIGLDEVKAPLLITAADIERGTTRLFRSWADGRNEPTRLVDAVVIACAAPTYFDPSRRIGGRLLADGGFWAYNPALVAFSEAHALCGGPRESIRIFSVGSGRSANYYGGAPPGLLHRLWLRATGWGLATRWRVERLLELQINLQGLSTLETLRGILGEEAGERFLHLSFESPALIRFDDSDTGAALHRYADEVFRERRSDIAGFLGLEAGGGSEAVRAPAGSPRRR